MSPILKFRPRYFSAPWGGRRIGSAYRRDGVPAVCSESWEISGHRSAPSVVVGGAFDGRTLDELAVELGRDLVGAKAPSPDRFPLLLKLIDAREALSLQVHPNERTAPLTGGEPKTELWYVLDAEPGAVLYAGFRRPTSERALRDAVAHGPQFVAALQKLSVSAGDALFIPGGMVHAIGGGSLIFEVQQSSDTTYRFYDWDRRDASGRGRELHLEQAFRSIDYALPPAAVWRDGPFSTPFFSVAVREVPVGGLTLRTDGTTFIAGFVFSGATDVARLGESFLVPAAPTSVTLTAAAPGTRLLLVTL